MKLKPFRDIPGPLALPLIGTLYQYMPFIGSYSFKRLHRNAWLNYINYGRLVRENIVGNVNLLHVFDTEDMERVFEVLGRFPMRRSHTAMEKYRLDRPHMYANGGLIPSNGEEWWSLRRESQLHLNDSVKIRNHTSAVDKICKDFIQYLDTRIAESTKQIPNLLYNLEKCFLEINTYFVMDRRMKFFSKDSTKSDDERASTLRKAAETSTRTILKTDNGLPLWKYFNTPLYKKLCEAQDIIYRVALESVENRKTYLQEKGITEPVIRDDGSIAILDGLLLKTTLNTKQIVTIVCDATLAGFETNAFTLSFILYHLAMNQDKQAILQEETQQIFSASHSLRPASLLNSKYTRACIKESMRLSPLSVGIGRVVDKDFDLRGHLIPAGTVIVTQNQVASRLPCNFENASSFIPERWLEKTPKNHTRFASLPFGQGARACIGKRMSELALHIFILNMIRSYKLTWAGQEPLDCITNLINEPDQALAIEFERRF